MSEHKPMKEWPCPQEFVTSFEELEDLKIEVQKKEEELIALKQQGQLKDTTAWNGVREAIAKGSKGDARAVYNACHLYYDSEKKVVVGWEKGKCPRCDLEAQDALKQLNEGSAAGILVTEGKGIPTHQGGSVDPSEEAMREKRREGRRGMLPPSPPPPPQPPQDAGNN